MSKELPGWLYFTTGSISRFVRILANSLGKFSTCSYHDLLFVYSEVNLFMRHHVFQQCHLFTLGSS